MKTYAPLVIMAILAVGCSSSASTPTLAATSPTTVATSSTTTVTATTTTTTAPVTTTTLRPIEADYVWVNGARLVYRCAGEGSVSVLVENGLAGGLDSNQPQPFNFMGWESVVEGVSERVRVCVYNRRGVGGSDNTRQGVSLRTTQTQVDDLVVLVEQLGLSKPFVIVGHSIAGFNIRLLADQHPDLVAGAVFVDASHPGQLAAMADQTPAAGPVEWLDISTSATQVLGRGDMGAKPVVVLAGGLFKPPRHRETWLELQEDTATLSTNAKYILLEDSGHYVMGSRPDAVIDAIHWVLDEIDAGTS